MAKYENEDKWGKSEAAKISKDRGQLKGEATKGNLKTWSDYAASNSYDPRGTAGKAQARRDLSDAGANRDVNLGDTEGFPQKQGGQEDGKHWKHWSEVS